MTGYLKIESASHFPSAQKRQMERRDRNVVSIDDTSSHQFACKGSCTQKKPRPAGGPDGALLSGKAPLRPSGQGDQACVLDDPNDATRARCSDRVLRRRSAILPIHRRAHRSRKSAASYAAIFGIFRGRRNRSKPEASPIVEPARRVKCASRFDYPPTSSRKSHSGEFSMVITAAHVPAIVALIAGILILIMPRLLNFIVAIYLIFIGLVGMGLLKWLHL